MSDLQQAYADLAPQGVHFIGVAIPGETPAQIDAFRKTYGITFDLWMDVNFNYRKLVPPTGEAFPIDVVIDRDGVVRYLENDYVPGEAVQAVESALK